MGERWMGTAARRRFLVTCLLALATAATALPGAQAGDEPVRIPWSHAGTSGGVFTRTLDFSWTDEVGAASLLTPGGPRFWFRDTARDLEFQGEIGSVTYSPLEDVYRIRATGPGCSIALDMVNPHTAQTGVLAAYGDDYVFAGKNDDGDPYWDAGKGAGESFVGGWRVERRTYVGTLCGTPMSHPGYVIRSANLELIRAG